MAYTKGKWSYVPGDYNSQDQDIDTHPGSIVCDDGRYTWYVASVEYLQDEDGANAQLIAAAPDLLEALEALTNHTLGMYASGGDSVEAIVEAKAAIKRAKGEVSNA